MREEKKRGKVLRDVLSLFFFYTPFECLIRRRIKNSKSSSFPLSLVMKKKKNQFRPGKRWWWSSSWCLKSRKEWWRVENAESVEKRVKFSHSDIRSSCWMLMLLMIRIGMQNPWKSFIWSAFGLKIIFTISRITLTSIIITILLLLFSEFYSSPHHDRKRLTRFHDSMSTIHFLFFENQHHKHHHDHHQYLRKRSHGFMSDVFVR